MDEGALEAAVAEFRESPEYRSWRGAGVDVRCPRDAIKAGDRELYIWDRERAEQSSPGVPHVTISISDPGVFVELYDCPLRRNLLELEIEDFEGSQVLSGNDARSVLAFAEANWRHDVALVVHCEMGMSRSAGVAAALMRLAGTSPEFVFSRFEPNLWVYGTLVIRGGMSLGIGRP